MSSRLMNLPGELRERIYEFYSDYTTIRLVCNFGIVDDVLKPADVSQGFKKPVPLVRACRQSRSEILTSLAKFNTVHVPALHQLSSLTSLPNSLPGSVTATLRVLHITTAIDRLEPKHAKHVAFPCLREITFVQDPSEPMPIPAQFLSIRLVNYNGGYTVNEANNPRTLATVDRVVKTRCATLNRIFKDTVPRTVVIHVTIGFGRFKARNTLTNEIIADNTIVATTESIHTKDDDDNDDANDDKQGWRWAATETEFTEAAHLWTATLTEHGEDVAVWLSPGWGEMNFNVK